MLANEIKYNLLQQFNNWLDLIYPQLLYYCLQQNEIILLSYTISIMGIESLFIIDDSLDNRLQNAQQASLNGPVLLNKFEGAQMEHDQRIRMTAAARNQMRMVEFGNINTEHITEIERDRIVQRLHDYRNRKRQNDSDEI